MRIPQLDFCYRWHYKLQRIRRGVEAPAAVLVIPHGNPQMVDVFAEVAKRNTIEEKVERLDALIEKIYSRMRPLEIAYGAATPAAYCFIQEMGL